MGNHVHKKTRIIFILLCFIFSIAACTPIKDTSGKDLSNHEEIPYEALEKDSEDNKDVENPAATVSIAMGGDVMMTSYFADYIKSNGVDYPLSDLSPLFEAADLSCINLETSVSERGQTFKPEGYGFRSEPYTLEGLSNNHVDIVNIANNHTFDFGETAFLDTLEHLKNYNIRYFGGGYDSMDADKPLIMTENNLKIGFLGFTEIIPIASAAATPSSPGINFIKENYYEQIFKTIESSKELCDILLVSLHWGKEYSSHPEDYQVLLAHQLIDYGADAVIGHHPHVLQGIEFYKEKPILYSIGNLAFLKKNDDAGKTALFELNFDKSGFTYGQFYPVSINYCQSNLLEKESAVYQEIHEKIASLSESFNTDIDEHCIFKNGGSFNEQ